MAKAKYTLEYVTKQIESLLDQLHKDKAIIYIGQLFEDKPYGQQRYNEWVSLPVEKDRALRYGDKQDIYDMSVTIKDILKSRAMTGALLGELSSPFTMFHMKNNYDMVDKKEVVNTNTNLEYQVDDSEEMQELLKNNKLI